ncbi:MAG: hypothetical protein Fur0035_15390 [Anaerolineales bacterium]
MKQDKFLSGILIGIAVLVVLALAVFFLRKDNLQYGAEDIPDGVVRNYIIALHKGEYERAYGYLADLPNKPAAEKFRQDIGNGSVNLASAGIEILKTEISGETAYVSLAMVYGASDPFSGGYRGNTTNAVLIRQAGAWKIKEMPSPYWGYDWYQGQ